jgi:hypothetical protein
MREKNVSAKRVPASRAADEYTMRVELAAKVNTTMVVAAGSERMEKIANSVTKLLARAAKYSRYEAIMVCAVVKMFAENVLQADQAEIDRTILMIKQGTSTRVKPVN